MTQPTTDSSAERQKGSAVNQLTASPGKGQAQGREPDQKASSEDHTKAAIETRQPKSAEGEVEEEEEDEEDEDIPIVDYSKKPETSADVSSTIMLQIPTYNLANLRKEFEAEPDGLNLTQFVRTFVRNMNLEDDEAMLNIIPDLVNFFNLVDINGDGHMEWSEFVMFVIEQVVKGDDTKVYEELQLVERVQIQPPSSREIVSCAKFIVELNKLVLAVGDEVQVYETDESSSSWMGEPLKIKSRKKETINASVDSMGISGSFSKGGVRERVNRKLEESLRILDLVYIGSADILVILRNDMVLEFLKFTSRAKNSSDVVIHFGMQFLPKSYNRIVCRDVKKQSVILFALDNTEFVHCFDVDVGESI